MILPPHFFVVCPICAITCWCKFSTKPPTVPLLHCHAVCPDEGDGRRRSPGRICGWGGASSFCPSTCRDPPEYCCVLIMLLPSITHEITNIYSSILLRENNWTRTKKWENGLFFVKRMWYNLAVKFDNVAYRYNRNEDGELFIALFNMRYTCQKCVDYWSTRRHLIGHILRGNHWCFLICVRQPA